MNRLINFYTKRSVAASILAFLILAVLAVPSLRAKEVSIVPTLPILWSAGGVTAGNDGMGQSGKIVTDVAGNVSVVSGPALGSSLGVTSYSQNGMLRWQQTAAPAAGTINGVWIEAAPNGDILAVGANVDSSGRLFGVIVVRYSSVGMLQWRFDSSEVVLSFGRIVVDADGNAYFQYNSTLSKFSPNGSILWSVSTVIPNGSAAISSDGVDLVLTGAVGGAWRTAIFNAETGAERWRTIAPEGPAATDVVIDNSRVYVAGQGVTGAGTPAIAYFLTVIAYDRATGERLWRTDRKPADANRAAGLRIAKSSDGTLVVTGHALRGFLDWYTVAFENSGVVRWEAVRDGGLNTDEIPAHVLVLPDRTTVVTGTGGPYLPNGFIQGVTVGYSPEGTLLWEAFSRFATTWSTALPSGDVCAAGGYDAFLTCFDTPSINTIPVANFFATPTNGVGPLTVSFDGRASSGPNTLMSWDWNFGDGSTGVGAQTEHIYTTPGKYVASLVVTDIMGASSVPQTLTITVIPATPLPPTAPINLSIAAKSRNSANLIWTNTSSDQTSVKVERCRGATCTNFIQIASIGGASTAYSDSNLALNTIYQYRVRASNAGGDSPYSNIIRIRTSKR